MTLRLETLRVNSVRDLDQLHHCWSLSQCLHPLREREIHQGFRVHRLANEPAIDGAIDDQFDFVHLYNAGRAHRWNKTPIKFFRRGNIEIENPAEILRGFRFILWVDKEFGSQHQSANPSPDLRRILLYLGYGGAHSAVWQFVNRSCIHQNLETFLLC